MLEVSKKENETSQALIRRFKKQLQKSGLLLQVRKKMFRERPKSKLKIREAAKKREEMRKQMEYLRKLGKVETKK